MKTSQFADWPNPATTRDAVADLLPRQRRRHGLLRDVQEGGRIGLAAPLLYEQAQLRDDRLAFVGFQVTHPIKTLPGFVGRPPAWRLTKNHFGCSSRSVNLENDGAPLFAAAIEADGRSQGDIGAELGMSQQKVSLILKMRSVPTEVERILIELLFGVPRDSWLTRDEQRRIQDMRTALSRAGKRPVAVPSIVAR